MVATLASQRESLFPVAGGMSVLIGTGTLSRLNQSPQGPSKSWA
jgi:hypothetical protein